MKSVKQYFYEFIMIFLAVALGFFSENLREYMSNRKLERDYIQSFIGDLEIDSRNLERYIQMLENRIIYLDTLILSIRQPNERTISTYLYTYSIKGVLWLGKADKFKPTETTLRLLENDGFSIISNRATLDSILFYHSLAQRVSTHYDYMFETNRDLIEDLTEIIDFKIVNEIWDSSAELEEGFFSSDIKPIQYEPQTSFGEYKNKFLLLNRLENQKRLTQRSLHNHKITLRFAERCIRFIQRGNS